MSRNWGENDLQFPGLAALFIILHPENSYRDRPVHFIEKNEAVLAVAKASEDSRLAGLLVSQAPPAKKRSQPGRRSGKRGRIQVEGSARESRPD